MNRSKKGYGRKKIKERLAENAQQVNTGAQCLANLLSTTALSIGQGRRDFLELERLEKVIWGSASYSGHPIGGTHEEVNEQMNGVKYKSLREKQFIQLGWRRATVLETVILKTGD
ncbi:Dedicator Of Cytokinesis Protein 11 [Manis pentadactyla]|nr:Dedicator Of Cytokinesis Protein 11 [Manis pentadactyla]